MIDRYSLPPMGKIWNDEAKYYRWWKVECAFLEELPYIKGEDKKNLRKKIKELEKPMLEGSFLGEFLAEEELTRHDVLAFVQVMSRKLGENDLGKFFHLGITSSDVLDTALSLALREAGNLILSSMETLIHSLEEKAFRYKDLLSIGRSHGKWAEPSSFGLKFMSFAQEMKRNEKRLKESLEDLSYGKISGPVGNSFPYGVDFEKKILKRLSLKREPISTQVMPRDRHAFFIEVLALCGASLERMALEIRHLQRSEVLEVEEPFSKKQKGSSAMPHKKNPILSENICGLARLLRSYVSPSLENIALWHERDMSHSSVERVLIPDATTLLHYALHKMNYVIEGLQVHEKTISERAQKAYMQGGALSARLLHYFVLEKGMGRQEAYELIQKMAFSLSSEADLRTFLKKNKIKFEGKDHLKFVSEILKDLKAVQKS